MRFFRRVAVLSALATVVSLGLAGTAQAATGGRSLTTRRSVVVTFINNYTGPMWLYSTELDHGRWVIMPPQEIDPGQQGVWSTVSSGLFTGTEGWAAFTVYGWDDGDMRIHWDNPFAGGNTFQCIHRGPLDCTWTSSGSDDASVTFELS